MITAPCETFRSLYVDAVPPLAGYVLGKFLGRTLHLSFSGPCQPQVWIILICSRSVVLWESLYSWCVLYRFFIGDLALWTLELKIWSAVQVSYRSAWCNQIERVFCSVSEWKEESNACSNPFLFSFTGWELNEETEVGRMTRSGQGSCTWKYLVNGAIVDAGIWRFTVFLGQEPDKWELSIELLRIWVIQIMGLTIPSCTFHVHTIDETTILRRLGYGWWCSIVAHLEVKAKLIDGDLVLSGIILERTSEESLREKEARDPEGGWGTTFNPLC